MSLLSVAVRNVGLEPHCLGSNYVSATGYLCGLEAYRPCVPSLSHLKTEASDGVSLRGSVAGVCL